MADARLEVTDALGRRIVPISKSPFEIGRRETNDLRLAGSEVSRDHAEIAIDGNRFKLQDRNSRYGTYVNGEQVTERILVHGDKVRLGRIRRRRDGLPARRLAARRSTGRRRRRSATCARLRRCSRGCARWGPGRVLDDVLSLVLDSAIEVSGAERGFIMLALETAELEFKMARGRGHSTLSGGSFATSRKIPEEVFRTGEPRLVADLLDGDLANVHMGTVALGIRNVLCVPLRLVRYVDKAENVGEERRIGVLYLDSRRRDRCCRARRARRSRRWRPRPRSPSRTRGSIARRWRRRGWSRRCGSRRRSSRRCCRRPARAGAYFRAAAASLPCRSIGGDFYDYVEMRQRGARVRARRRGGQGTARGAPERDDAGHVRRAGGDQRRAVADHHAA